METALWTAQVLRAALFLATGLTKLTQPRAQLAAGPMGWAADVSDVEFRAVGVLEILGALGLVLPGALGIAPFLTPLAAVGLALTMVGAIATHVRRGETDRLVVPVVLLALTLFVAVERFGPHSL
ncbi:MAG: DoxX family protein [Aeromicrobium sp.]